jgi:hypothetical protein
MVPAGACLILSQLVLYALATVIEPQAFVPVSLHPVGGSHVEARSPLREGLDVLRPRPNVELLYAQRMYILTHKVIVTLANGVFCADGSSDTNPYVVNVTASHKNMSYVLIEDFESMLSLIRCVNAAVDPPTSVVLRFKDNNFFEQARDLWISHNELLFVTHHDSCNEGHKRGVYRYAQRKS